MQIICCSLFTLRSNLISFWSKNIVYVIIFDMFRYALLTNYGEICKCLISTWKEYIFPPSWIQDLTCVHHSTSVSLLFCLIHLPLWWQDSKLILAIVSIFASYVLGWWNKIHTNQMQKTDVNQILIQYTLEVLNSLMKNKKQKTTQTKWSINGKYIFTKQLGHPSEGYAELGFKKPHSYAD